MRAHACAVPPTTMPLLLMITASGETRQVPLKPHDNKVGRGTGNDVVVDSSQASRDHAVIDVEHAFVTITDLGSRNGTFVNDVRIQSQVLADGDLIRLGNYAIRFVAADQEFSQVEAQRMMTMHGLLVNIDTERAVPEATTVPGVPGTTRGSI
jgi:pSer/pThr/pTyr-binding forkhead associated (FHA) protein